MAAERKTYGPNDVAPGDWIKYRSGYYGSGRLAEVHAIGVDANSGAYAVTTEGNVLFSRILEIRRRPINVVAFPKEARASGTDRAALNRDPHGGKS